MIYFYTELEKILQSNSLEFEFRINNEESWLSILDGMDFCPFVYSNYLKNYQLAYIGEEKIHDLSIIIKLDSRPIGLFLLSLQVKENYILSSFGYEILNPVFLISASNKSRKKILKKLVGSILGFLEYLKLKDVCFRDINFSDLGYGISEWHETLLQFQGIPRIEYSLYVDLDLTLEEIKSFFRKSYKPLINSAKKLWNYEVIERPTKSIWNEFRDLHKKVSGRETRNNESWEIQFKTFESLTSFLVLLKNDEGELIGGGFFFHTRDEGIYSMGVYDRSLFDKPLGHLVQIIAIEKFKERGIKRYNIGKRYFDFYNPEPSEKELSISDFKQGFSTFFAPEYVFQICLNK